MIKEDYVSFETAKLLKEKGFSEPCKIWYAEYTSAWGGDPSGDRKYINIQFDDRNRFNESYKFLCYAPTLQMAMKWLREVHNLFIEISVDEMLRDKGYQWALYDNSTKEIMPYSGWENTYEESCEAAIKYCLENLI